MSTNDLRVLAFTTLKCCFVMYYIPTYTRLEFSLLNDLYTPAIILLQFHHYGFIVWSEYSKVSPLHIMDTNFLFKMFPLFSLISPSDEFWSWLVKFHIKPKWNLGWYCIELVDYIGGGLNIFFSLRSIY